MHALEKILAAHAGFEEVKTGEIVNCNIDVGGINDLYPQAMYSFHEMGGTKVRNPDNVVIFFDHYAPPSSVKQATNQKEFRSFCREQNIEMLMDINTGVCHQVLADRGLCAPGKTIVVTDSHTTTHGAFGAFATGVGATDLAIILLTGKLWFRVPEIIRIELHGKLREGVYAKDVILHIIGDLGADFAIYKGVEFCGSLIEEMDISERMTLCNMTTEMGAKCSFIAPDKVTMQYLKEKHITDYAIYTTDDGYEYSSSHSYDVGELEPQVASPHDVDNVGDISQSTGIAIQQAFLGTCTNGRVDDIAIAAKIVEGHKINPDTRFVVVPASRSVLQQAISNGYIQTLVEAGATLVSPGCAACLGTHQGIIAKGENCISTSNRNFPGRMGHTEAGIYIASPATVAASAIEGAIADPRKYLEED